MCKSWKAYQQRQQCRTQNIKNCYPRWVRYTALFLMGVWIHVWIPMLMPSIVMAQPATPTPCDDIVSPLTPEEEANARVAWSYFAKNYQPTTGFANSAGGYPSGSLWDIANYLMALNAARWLKIIEPKEYDGKINQFLSGISKLQLFENTLPNKVYHAKTGVMVNYANKPVEKGIGWSALDVGRTLAAFHVIRTCQPQYKDWLNGIVSKWQVAKSVKDEMLYGAFVRPDKTTLLVQEGRLGYEEYAVRGYELWGFKAPKAKSFAPSKLVDIYGIKIPVDERDYQTTKANNYVVSESFILDGIEFGLEGEIADYAAKVFKLQQLRYEKTGQLTAVTEDNIDQAPYFLYNTIYSNGVAWATINEKNQPYPDLRTISTKAAFGWHYLYPKSEYARKLYEAVKDLKSPKGDGYYAGQYELTKLPNKSLTGNTNGLILEMLHFKALGNQPLARIRTDQKRRSIKPTPMPGAASPRKKTTVSPPPIPMPGAAPPRKKKAAVSPPPPPPSETAPAPTLRRQPSEAQPDSANSCARIISPLTPEEQIYAEDAWQYFVRNYQEKTGFTNSAGGFPSGSLWDMSNYLMALNSARWLNIIEQKEYDNKLTKFLMTLSNLQLFENALPNKVYHAGNAKMVNYANKPVEKGIGWSALDIGRTLAAFHVLRSCQPQYGPQLQSIVDKWQVSRSIKDGMLYGAFVRPDKTTLLVQEGRLGYEEYAVRGYEMWGFKAPKALSFQPFKFVDIYGIQIPVDVRDYQTTKANNYVVSESYVLDGIEFGLNGVLADYAARVLQVQERRYRSTGQLTAVTEDNIDKAPYFIYNTIFSNGVAWASINEKNQPFNDLRTISTKAAFGWRYLFPTNDYAKKVFDVVKDLRSPKGDGFYAGQYEASKQPNKSLTGNTNGLILEILHFKALGNQPLVGKYIAPISSGVPFVAPATPIILPEEPRPLPRESSPASFPKLYKPLGIIDKRYAQAAWAYFEANTETTGLVNDRTNVKGATLWGLGNYLMALHSARTLGVIDNKNFDTRVRNLLGTMSQLPLAMNELPHRSYNTWSLQPVDYGNNPTPDGTGWSGLDLGRMMTALYTIKNFYPIYTEAIDKMVLDWSYLRVVRNGFLNKANMVKDVRGRLISRIEPETRLGYEEYAARSFQLWGFDMNRAAVGDNYTTTDVEGAAIPTQRSRPEIKDKALSYTVSTPFLLYGLEYGWDPKMSSLAVPMFKAEAARYQRTSIFTASATMLIDEAPYVLHSTVLGKGEPWATLSDNGKNHPESRIVSTATAFGWSSLFPNNTYAKELRESVLDVYSRFTGFYEGFYEKTGKPTLSTTSTTNALILESLLYRSTNQQPLVRPDVGVDSPWWKAVREGDSGRGLPLLAKPMVKFIADADPPYWVGIDTTVPTPVVSPVVQPPAPVPTPVVSPVVQPPVSMPTPVVSPVVQPPAPVPTPVAFGLIPLSAEDRQIAQTAWQYFIRNRDSKTGLVSAVTDYPWTTLWDQGSVLLAMHSAQQLGILSPEQFKQWMTTALDTLTNLPLPSTRLPNKAYSTQTAQMRKLNNMPDPQGQSGTSALDTARFMTALHIVKKHHPEYYDRINKIVGSWETKRLIKEEWLAGIILFKGKLRSTQEGRLGYEQYAANGLKLWGLEAFNSLNKTPIRRVKIEDIALEVDQRDQKNSGAGNYLTNDPYILWGLEMGWPDNVKPQVKALLDVQEKRWKRTGILTAVNEDSLNRPPYFLYYNVYANGQNWVAITPDGKSYPDLRFVSTKAAFGWSALLPDNSYARKLRLTMQNLAVPERGFYSGRYEKPQMGNNSVIDANTNAVILESLLYKAKGRSPLID
jgi:Protein of unknown function (DUF3131)